MSAGISKGWQMRWEMSANQWCLFLPNPSFCFEAKYLLPFTVWDFFVHKYHVSPPLSPQKNKSWGILQEKISLTAVCEPPHLHKVWHSSPSASHFLLTLSKILQTHLFSFLHVLGRCFPALCLSEVWADLAFTCPALALLMMPSGHFLSAV